MNGSHHPIIKPVNPRIAHTTTIIVIIIHVKTE